eukprot:2915854-Pyramimonas_sp.AAC.1
MGRRSRAAAGPAGDQASPDWTRLNFSTRPSGRSVDPAQNSNHTGGRRWVSRPPQGAAALPRVPH